MDSADDAEMDGKPWIQCDRCFKWNHTDCEIQLGEEKHFCLVAEDSKRQEEKQQERNKLIQEGKLDADMAILDEEEEEKTEVPYFCLTCRQVMAEEEKKTQANAAKKQNSVSKRSSGNNLNSRAAASKGKK